MDRHAFNARRLSSTTMLKHSQRFVKTLFRYSSLVDQGLSPMDKRKTDENFSKLINNIKIFENEITQLEYLYYDDEDDNEQDTDVLHLQPVNHNTSNINNNQSINSFERGRQRQRQRKRSNLSSGNRQTPSNYISSSRSPSPSFSQSHPHSRSRSHSSLQSIAKHQIQLQSQSQSQIQSPNIDRQTYDTPRRGTKRNRSKETIKRGLEYKIKSDNDREESDEDDINDDVIIKSPQHKRHKPQTSLVPQPIRSNRRSNSVNVNQNTIHGHCVNQIGDMNQPVFNFDTSTNIKININLS